MNPQDLLISNQGSDYQIKIIGRANFEYAVPLRQLSHCLNQGVGSIKIDGAECVFMDSTFMGVLSMLALQAKRFNASVTIYHLSEHVHGLLHGLGVDKLFIFSDEQLDGSDYQTTTPQSDSALETAQTVSEAHQTLVNADADNASKFKAVIDFAEADVERLKKQKDEQK